MIILLIFNVHGKLDADLFLVSFNIAEPLLSSDGHFFGRSPPFYNHFFERLTLFYGLITLPDSETRALIPVLCRNRE